MLVQVVVPYLKAPAVELEKATSEAKEFVVLANDTCTS